MITVTIWHKDDTPKTIPLEEGQTIIGRDPRCGIHLDTDSVSRKHARLIYSDKKLLLTDLESANGTYIGDRRIKEEGLRHGDTIRIADFLLTFQAAQANTGGAPTRILEKPRSSTKSGSWFSWR